MSEEVKDWESSVHPAIRHDLLWTLDAYRAALRLSDEASPDVASLVKHHSFGLADQMERAAGSISANLAEGYSRKSPRERARFYEYALGSARELRDWYHKARMKLGPTRASERIASTTAVIQMTCGLIRLERQRAKTMATKASPTADRRPPKTPPQEPE